MTHLDRWERIIAKLRRAFCVMLVALIMFTILPIGSYGQAQAASDGMVRVKLTRLGSPGKLVFKTTCAYQVAGNASLKIASGATVTVNASGGKLYLTVNGKKSDMGATFSINRMRSGTYGAQFSSPSFGNLFCGDLIFSTQSGGVGTVIRMYVEDYLYGVVAYEMSDSFPLEALKAQAVAARTYVMRSKKSTGQYDVDDTSNNQVFKGYNASYKNVIRAVNETKGVCAMYGGDYAQCYYTASNGGQIEITKNIWGGVTSYITMKDDKYDLENPASVAKTHSIPKKPSQSNPLNSALSNALISAMSSKLSAQGMKTAASTVSIDEILAVEPHTPRFSAPSRLHTKVRFSMDVTATRADTGNKVKLSDPVTVDLGTYDQLKSLLKLGINSSKWETVEAKENASSFALSFRRYGHGIGMSQRGAQWMAKQYGMNYQQILNFYYEGITLKNGGFADTTSSSGSGQTTTTPKPTATPKPTPTPTPATVYVRTKLAKASSKITVRKTASSKAKSLGKLKNNARLELLSVKGSWAQIKSGSKKGYLPGINLVYETDGLYVVPTPTPKPTPTPTPVPVYARVKLAKSSSTVTVRKTASSKGKSLGKIKHNARVQYISLNGTWAKIKSGSKTGFIQGKYLTLESDGSYVVPTPKPTATPTPTPAPVYARVKLAKSSSTVTVRKTASSSAKSLGKIKHNARVQYISLNGTWAKIKSGSKTGYLQGKYLVLESSGQSVVATPAPKATSAAKPTPTPKPATDAVQIKMSKDSQKLTVYAKASKSAQKLGTLKHGTELTAIQYKGNWAYIEYKGKKGYVEKKYLEKISD